MALLDILLIMILMVVAYLLGSIPTGYLIARARGIDIQSVGSGNIGATNVLRSVGPVAAIVVVIMDPLKGFLAAILPLSLGMNHWAVALSILAVVLGNNFNIFLKMRGGKGIATSVGALLTIEPILMSLALVLGLTIILLARLVSLGSLVGGLAFPLFMLARGSFDLPYFLLSLILLTLAFWRHRDNVIKLMKGTERRIGEKATASDPHGAH